METEQTKQAWLQGTIPTEGEGMAHTQMQPSHTHTQTAHRPCPLSCP